MTPLERIVRREIAAEGPMPLDRYMALCLGHPEHGYYMTRDPLGTAGDFVTAPEVSQMFGELIGVWCATVWRALGAPAPFALVELGPGRGTLMADALRAAGRAAGFVESARLYLVETSPVLKALQAKTIGRPAVWCDRLDDVPSHAMILVANEFFDAIPIRQLQWQGGRWFERCVGVDLAGNLAIGLIPAAFEASGEEGAIFELAPLRNTLALNIGRRLATAGGAALIVDYGHAETSHGDTLQAVRDHAFADLLASPGEADITSHVDFEALGQALRNGGAAVHGPSSQRDFLFAMGFEQRAAALRAAAGGRQIDMAIERLAGPAQMGNLFKVLAATSPGAVPPYPFGAP